MDSNLDAANDAFAEAAAKDHPETFREPDTSIVVQPEEQGPLVLAELAPRINQEHRQVVDAANDALQHAQRCGELLIEAKAQCEHGDWLPWLAENCEVSERAARGYMQVARELPLLLVSKRQSIADLPTLEGALKLLAIPLEPEPEGETEPEPPVSQIPEPVPQPPAQPVPILDVQVQPASRAPVPQPPAAKDRTHRPQSQNGQPVNRAKWKELEELLGKTLNRTDLLNHADPHAILHRRMIDGIKQAMRDLADWNAARWTTAGPDAPADATPEDTMKRVNSDIEAFCRRIMAIAESEMPTDEWIKYNGRGETAMQKIKDACSTLRSCKCSAQCPKCNGEGCTRCLDTGRVTHYMLEQMT